MIGIIVDVIQIHLFHRNLLRGHSFLSISSPFHNSCDVIRMDYCIFIIFSKTNKTMISALKITA